MAQIEQFEDRRSSSWLGPVALFIVICVVGLALGVWITPDADLAGRLAEPPIAGALIVAMAAVYVVTRLSGLQDRRESLETAARLSALEAAVDDALARPPVSEAKTDDAAR